jgi:pimeloyl-ACP methyl ester carboxylesterase
VTELGNAVSGYVALPGADLYYEDVGLGLPVVLVHGLGLDTRMWDDQTDALAGVARVIRYDARGFGRSSRHDDETPYTHGEDLWALLDGIDVGKAVLVGHSMGGRTVLEAALTAPERTLALGVLAPVLDGVRWDDKSWAGMQAVDAGLRERGLDGAKEAWLAHEFFQPAGRSPELARRLAEMVSAYSGVHWTSPDPHGPHPDCLHLLPMITCRTAVLIGGLDVPGFRVMSETIADGVPDARLHVVPDAGHMVNMEAPAAVNAVLLDMIRFARGHRDDAGPEHEAR